MQEYFGKVMMAERKIFGGPAFTKSNVRSLPMKSGDLNLIDREYLSEAMKSEIHLIFGASFIKGWLAEELVQLGAINIHMGLSPHYRGSSCNFWAMYDERPQFVGATVHKLSKGLDSGDMLFHVRPEFDDQDPFVFTMLAVRAVQDEIVLQISAKTLLGHPAREQDRALQLRYSRNADFTDSIAREFLSRPVAPNTLADQLQAASQPLLLLPER